MVLANGDSSSKGSIRLVRGCPCYKVFGDEKLCVNDDNVLSMDVIELDPTLFTFHEDKAAMDLERADSDSICYCSIYVNYPDNRVHCISQGWVIRIHGRDVPGDDLEEALQFLTTKDISQSAEICSECLYKFLLTLSDEFSDTLSRKEKTDEVKKYIAKFALMIAAKLSQTDPSMKPIGTEEEVKDGVDYFLFLEQFLVQLKRQYEHWREATSKMVSDRREDWVVALFRNREKLARALFQFYSQTLQLLDISDYNLMIRQLSFILRTADEILGVNSKIHNGIRSDRFPQAAETDEQMAPLTSYAEMSRTVEHNFGNILQILSKL